MRSIDRPRNILFDLRETDDVRGFHLLSALKLAAPALRDHRLHYASNGTDSEMLAINSWKFDCGFAASRWWGEALPFGLQFDFYIAVAETAPVDSLSEKARSLARQAILGLTFPLAGPCFGVVVLPANDVMAFAHDLGSRLMP